MYPDLELRSNGVSTPFEKQKKTLLNYIPNVVEAFKGIRKVSNYYRRILVQNKPKGKPTYKDKIEKMFDITLRQGNVNKVAGMLNSSMIPVNHGDILHRLFLGI